MMFSLDYWSFWQCNAWKRPYEPDEWPNQRGQPWGLSSELWQWAGHFSWRLKVSSIPSSDLSSLHPLEALCIGGEVLSHHTLQGVHFLPRLQGAAAFNTQCTAVEQWRTREVLCFSDCRAFGDVTRDLTHSAMSLWFGEALITMFKWLCGTANSHTLFIWGGVLPLLSLLPSVPTCVCGAFIIHSLLQENPTDVSQTAGLCGDRSGESLSLTPFLIYSLLSISLTLSC